MRSPLNKLAEIQLNHTRKVILAALAITVLLATGIPKIQLQTDFQDSLSDDLDPIQAQEEVQAKFGNQDAIIILFELSGNQKEESYPSDIRDPRVIRTMNFLEQELEREPIVASTNSMASLFEDTPNSTEQVKQRLQQSQASFVDRDYTATTMFVRLSEESNEENIREATNAIKENIEQSPKYPGVNVRVTGMPVVRTDIGDILVNDTISTIAIASMLILGLLSLVRGIAYGPITFVPLLGGLIWALGVMGWLGIPLTFATIALGSMILGLGVEYGSFMTERILEEQEENGIDPAIRTAVPNTGKAILGSASTDGVGFLALLLASISFIRDLGITLALGEFLTVTAALAVTPALMIEYQRWRKQ